MRKEFTGTGKSVEAAVEAAIEAACIELGCLRDDHEWDIEIIDMPRKSFLGLKTNPARAKVGIELPDEKPAPKPQSKPAQTQNIIQKPQEQNVQKPAPKQREERPRKQEQPQKAERNIRKNKREYNGHADSAERSAPLYQVEISEKERLAKAYIEDVVAAAGLKAQCTVTHEHGGTCINITGDGLGMIIGRRGETLDALQYLAGLVANRGEGEYLRLTVDCGDYRLKRKDTLEALAKKLAGQVLKTNVSKTLEPMNPFERRIIHATVSEIEGVSSSSIGEEPNRRVVITSPTAKPAVRSGYRSGGDRGRDERIQSRRPQGRRPYNPGPPASDYSDIKTVSPERGPEFEDGETGVPRDARPQRAERQFDRGNKGGRDDRRGGGRDNNRRGGRRQPAPIPSGPPKKTPESEKIAGVSFGKIDLE